MTCFFAEVAEGVRDFTGFAGVGHWQGLFGDEAVGEEAEVLVVADDEAKHMLLNFRSKTLSSMICSKVTGTMKG